ncbi:MAG: NAD(P)H-dependent oxidoreductase [Gemmatimonadetes bacterium]|nr:NAD(P)H-dependent oxidoreductase [Gemmatimonadota bacterium]
MNTLILDGSAGSDPAGDVIHSALDEELRTVGATVRSVRVSEKRIGPCMGDFFCWTRSPGECTQDDDNREISRAFVGSDLVVLLTPITFGGYSSELKQALDHLIPNISPFFVTLGGETHHARRYPEYPRILVVGWRSAEDSVAEGVFHHMVTRNALNMYPPAAVSCVIDTAWEPGRVREVVAGRLQDALEGSGRIPTVLPPVEKASAGAPPKRALLLTGSPRGKKSTSQALGGFLLDRLEERGVATETVRLYTVQKSLERRAMLLHPVDETDLVVLAFPVYVDSLPAPVVASLECIAFHRRQTPPRRSQRFVALSNCGFPEPAHTETPLAICAQFARESGFAWAGGLGLGGGEGLVHGMPLEELGGRAARLRKALDLTAASLAIGGPVPAEAEALLRKPAIAPWLYRMVGYLSWRKAARRHGVQRAMKATPYA